MQFRGITRRTAGQEVFTIEQITEGERQINLPSRTVSGEQILTYGISHQAGHDIGQSLDDSFGFFGIRPTCQDSLPSFDHVEERRQLLAQRLIGTKRPRTEGEFGEGLPVGGIDEGGIDTILIVGIVVVLIVVIAVAAVVVMRRRNSA